MSEIRVDLYSDTLTRPTSEMRRVIAEAPVGDEQHGEDPSVNRLCAEVVELLGKDAAVFLPSGTMCNEIAVCVHCRQGDEIICDHTSHLIHAETGGPAALAGAMIRSIRGERGVYSAEQMERAVRDGSRHAPLTRLVCIEQTSNQGGGTVWPLDKIEEVAARARDRGLLLHMDGARLMNAVVASGVPAKAFAAPMDSVWIDLSKGLGCPVGGVLAGSEEFIHEAWRWKQRLGGAMRQAGILAAAGSYALAHHVERLAEDHANARRFAERIAGIPGIVVELDHVETNLVFFDTSGSSISAAELTERLLARGVRVGAMGKHRVRAVTHLDVDEADIDFAADALKAVLSKD